MAMLGTKVQFICSRVIVSHACRNFQTNAPCMSRNRKKEVSLPGKEDMVFTDPGVAYRSAAFKDDPELLKEVAENEFDLDDLEADFSGADKVYDEMKREKKKERERVAQIVAYKKLFKGPPQPPMLTFQERQLIHHLHKEDPQEWDVKKLSESFPANEEAIKKVLRNHALPKNEERIKKINARVERNWQLLAEGKLDVPLELIKHYKKFVDRRRNLTAQLDNPEFYKMPVIEPKVTWKAGEMSKIMLHYEKKIKQLYQRQIEGNSSAAITGGNEIAVRKSTLNAKQAILERIEFDREIQKDKGKESFVVGGDCDVFGESVTYDQLEKQIHESAKNNEELSVFDKMILEKSSEKNTEGDSFFLDSKFLELDKNQKARSGNVIDSIIKNKRKESKESAKGISERNHKSSASKSFDGKSQEKLKGGRKNEKNIASWKKEPVEFKPFEKDDFRNVDESALKGKAIRLTVEEIGNALEYEEGSKPKLKVLKDTKAEVEVEEQKEEGKKKKSVVKSMGAGDNLMKPQIEFSPKAGKQLDKLFFDKEVEDIEDTCFWNSKDSKKKKAMPAVASVKIPSRTESEDYYPEKIEIPKEYEGSGLTFKVKDCYYDDDGEFLYRVPGMTK